MQRSSSTVIRLGVVAIVASYSLFGSLQTFAQSADSSASSATSSSTSSVEETTITPLSGSGINILPGKGVLIIEQKDGSGTSTIGKWLTILPDNQQKNGSGALATLDNTSAGSYTIFATLPTGASSTIRIYRNNTLENTLIRPQANFTIKDGDTVRVVIHYTITQVGLVSVDSDPQGISFHMDGPNNTHFTGKTPAQYDAATEGQYKVSYDPITGCTVPAAQSLKLQAGNRISFSVRLSCPMADKLRERLEQNQTSDESHIVVTYDGKSITMRDVPQTSWFAPYVFNTAKYGILSGYSDPSGTPTGIFGPENNVTISELAKTAHKIAGISAESFQSIAPENLLAQGQWFSPFFASAEKRGWTIFASGDVVPGRAATRGEVLVTLLQALDIRLNWQKGTFFTDVNTRTPYAGAIETAAAAKIVTGRTDEKGVALNTFSPSDPINRAELAKILSTMIDVYKVTGSSSSAK